ncbi:hypothetical protein FIU86_10030 [Roseovarius sp. THAF9]|uniref:hypothetical protein n=1 Tax=Roseovarius sp. THAF9 TaxID=2587847 RepID=UPI0012AA66C9|nr:hypothetical protein [Roseovarius sp. THAF9]QFT93184.1 hypothetical protein FIU86_10030 [Roseovarius sp. THAF9]
MTTLDTYPTRPALRVDLRNIAMLVTTVLLLALGGVALTAPDAGVSGDWHGNVAVSAPR